MGEKSPWRAAPEAMPAHWPEREDVRAPAVGVARGQAIRYISRRRADPEPWEELERRPWPQPDDQPRLVPSQLAWDSSWPQGAPERPISIHQLFNEGVYKEIQELVGGIARSLARAEEVVRGGSGAHPVIPAKVAHVFEATVCQPEWARTRVWDTRDPSDCVPLSPHSEDDPPSQGARPAFFVEWGARLGWEDKDMLRRVCVTGCSSGSRCARDTVIYAHHTGLRENYKPASDAMAVDLEHGWTTAGRQHLYTVPARLPPKNVVAQVKWKLEAGVLVSKKKWRVTSDDSVAAPGSDSRNQMIDAEDLGNVGLPASVTKLAEAIAIVKTATKRAGLTVSGQDTERVALWALDLTNAYRELAAARHEWWLQQFVWHDGVRLDTRCLFGTRHLVDLFQRVSTFVMAVARRRVQEYDARHPYTENRRNWQEGRRSRGMSTSCAFADIYLDDGFGLTCVGEGERLRGVAPSERRVALSLGVRGGRVAASLFSGLSRPEIHLAIVRATFEEAGW